MSTRSSSCSDASSFGHHLGGHTLVPGGSQPPIELEADRFSGFVLHKMGADLDQTTQAIRTLIPEGDGETHPGRARRLAAVESGWTDSCEQAGGTDCGASAAWVEPPAVAGDTPAAGGGDPAGVAGSGAAAPPPEMAAPGDSGQPAGAATAPDVAAAPPAQPGAEIVADPALLAMTPEQLEAELIALMGKMGEPGADLDAIGARMEAVTVAIANQSGVKVV